VLENVGVLSRRNIRPRSNVRSAAAIAAVTVNEGWYTVDECPSKFIGQDLISDIQVVSASEQHLPVAGGLLDQSAWWFELRQLLRSEEHKITEEQMERRK
jgi:hypothetical protein